jgi:hypothetical protein
MTKRRPDPTPKDCDEFADRVAQRLLTARRDRRRKLWRQVAYLLTLLGAVSGLLTLLVMLAEWW